MAGKSFTNQEIAEIFREIAAALEVKGDGAPGQPAGQFRIRAYQNAADSIEHATEEVKDLWERNQLTSLPGIGANLASYLDELFKTGQVKHFNQVKKSLPTGMFPLLALPGIGPKTAYKLAKQLKLTSEKTAFTKLKQAAKQGKISDLEGFATKSEEEILKTIIQDEGAPKSRRLRLDRAHILATQIIDYLNQSPAVKKCSPMGSLRRRNATVGDIDLGVATDQPVKVAAHIKKFPKCKKVLAAGEGLVRFLHENKKQIDVKIMKPQSYGSLLQHFTGSKKHNIHLRELALKKKLSLSEHGIKIKGKLKPIPTEKEFYHALGLAWIPPELREDRGEIQAAQKNQLPQLVTLKDIKGDLHTHTNFNWISSHDPADYSIKDLLEQAFQLGYQYIAVGDHNPSRSSYSETDIISQINKRNQKIEQESYSYNKRVKKRTLYILNSLEVDIRPDGSLAIPAKAATSLDFLVVAIHSSMKMDKKDMTNRILKALSLPKVKIFSHPTGRIIGRREGYEFDWQPVLTLCHQRHIALEINAHPARLDITDSVVKEAISKGIKVCINTDAHALEDLNYMQYGVDVARRGWATKADVINTYPWPRLKRWLDL